MYCANFSIKVVPAEHCANVLLVLTHPHPSHVLTGSNLSKFNQICMFWGKKQDLGDYNNTYTHFVFFKGFCRPVALKIGFYFISYT